MASGDIHHEYLKKGWTLVIPLGIIIALYTAVKPLEYYYLYPLFFYVNYLLCNIISPDADQIGVTSDEGIVLRTTKKFYLGFFGALFVSYTFIYAYLIGLVGGHRSPFSHGWVIGTLGRMIFYNAPVVMWMYNLYSYGLANWGWIISIGLYESMKMEVWLLPYLTMQFFAWFIGDGIHLILDTEWAKGVLYTPKNNSR